MATDVATDVVADVADVATDVVANVADVATDVVADVADELLMTDFMESTHSINSNV